MKKSVLIIFLILTILLANSLVLADEQANVDKAYECLKTKLGSNCGDIKNTNENAFTLLAMAYDSGIQSKCKSILDEKKNNNCWGVEKDSDCNIKSTSSSRKPVKIFGNDVTLNKDLGVKKSTESAAACITVNQCRQLNANKKITDDEGTEHIINSAYRMGYASKVSDDDTSPCFYDGSNNPNVVSDAPNQRQE